jgi:hypothetical protein
MAIGLNRNNNIAPFGNASNVNAGGMEEPITNRIHFFKFD